MKEKLLETRKLKKYFPVGNGKKLKALEDISIAIYQGEKFGVVGESGCGKSTLGRVILQLYSQTSGSCVYYGKSIEEINPKYINKEIKKLPEYQKNAINSFNKSIVLDKKIAQIENDRKSYDVDGSSKDAKKYDRLSKKMDKYSYQSKELKKDASRFLREGSRTVGSLIMSSHLSDVQNLFYKAEAEVQKAHDLLKKYDNLNVKYLDNCALIEEIKNTSNLIKELKDKETLNEQEKIYLEELKGIEKKNKGTDIDGIIQENNGLKPKMDKLSLEINECREKEKGFRKEAFEKYRGKDILEITERSLDADYQKKLDGNYETGINLNKLSKDEMKIIRKDIQMIFQDPSASLDPRQTVGSAIEEVFTIHTKLSAKAKRESAMELLEEVGLKREHYYSYPHMLSGGQKQRVGIARAIALNPSFVVLDEAVSALDVSVQAQIIQLLNKLSDTKNLTYFFITHDLGVAKHFCDRIMVMYLGNLCEIADSKELFKNPLHPYTISLLNSVPRLDINARNRNIEILQGEVPSAINPPSGCPFHTRCNKCMEICKKEKPKYHMVSENHYIMCHLFSEEISK